MSDPNKDHSGAINILGQRIAEFSKQLDQQVGEFSRQLERATARVEEVYRHLADGKTKSATQEIEILHIKQRVDKIEAQVNALEDIAATQKHITDAITPITQMVMEMRSTQTWLVRLIIGSVILAVLALLGIGVAK